MHNLTKAAIAAVMAFAGTAALPGTAAAEGALITQLTYASQYRWDGVSSSNNQPAAQASFYWWRPDRNYAGLFLTSVDFRDPGHTSYEVDVYAGHHFDLKPARVTAEVMYSFYPDNKTWGPTYDFIQGKLQVERKVGDIQLKALTTYTPETSYRGGRSWMVRGEAVYPITPNFSLNASLGHRWTRRQDRTYWSAGGTATWKALAFDLRYVDTDLSPDQCGYVRQACRPAVVGAVTVTFPPFH